MLKSKTDYAQYELDIVKAARWLEETSLDAETAKRQEVNAFVLKWLSGSPNVTVEVNEKVVELYKKNEQLLTVYLASYASYVLNTETGKDKFLATKAALTSMMNVYKKGVAITKNKEMEKLIKLTAQNKLDEYITSVLNIAKV